MRNLGQTLAIRSDQEHSYQHLLLHWESFVFLQGIKKDLQCLLLLINSYIVLFKDQTVSKITCSSADSKAHGVCYGNNCPQFVRELQLTVP